MEKITDLTQSIFEETSTGKLSIWLELFNGMREKAIVPTEQIKLQIYITLIKAELNRRLD